MNSPEPASSTATGRAAAALDAEYVRHDKITRLSRAAAWCQAHGYTGPYQIDIVSISGPLKQPSIELLENALG
jgi:hypothetical protein